MNDLDSPDDYYERIKKAVEGSVSNGEFVTKWIAIVEVVDADGDRGLWSLADDGSTVWDVMGMLDYTKQKVVGKVDMVTFAQHAVQFEEEDEDDEDQ